MTNGQRFARMLADAGLFLTEAQSAERAGHWNVVASADLAVKRGPAFYGEAEFSQSDAATALAAAERVLAWARALVATVS